MIYNWENDKSDDPRWFQYERSIITDAKTGERIQRVIWCDTETGSIRRYMVDENGKIHADEFGDTTVIEETRPFKIEFPDRKKTFNYNITIEAEKEPLPLVLVMRTGWTGYFVEELPGSEGSAIYGRDGKLVKIISLLPGSITVPDQLQPQEPTRENGFRKWGSAFPK